MTKPNRITYRGVPMIAGWPERIQEAQTQPTYSIGGKAFPRIRYGEESDDWNAGKKPCHDCAVFKGEFHVTGCDAEECPCCHGQAFSCDCDRDDEDED